MLGPALPAGVEFDEVGFGGAEATSNATPPKT